MVQIHQELNQALAVVGARTQFEHEMSVACIGFVDQGGRERESLPIEWMAQYRRLPSRRPRRAYRRQQRHARLVLEHDQRVLAPGCFFSCGQRSLTHCSMAASSRSTALRAGRCQLQRNCLRKMYQT